MDLVNVCTYICSGREAEGHAQNVTALEEWISSRALGICEDVAASLWASFRVCEHFYQTVVHPTCTRSTRTCYSLWNESKPTAWTDAGRPVRRDDWSQSRGQPLTCFSVTDGSHCNAAHLARRPATTLDLYWTLARLLIDSPSKDRTHTGHHECSYKNRRALEAVSADDRNTSWAEMLCNR